MLKSGDVSAEAPEPLLCMVSRGDGSMSSRAVSDRYRCPENLLPPSSLNCRTLSSVRDDAKLPLSLDPSEVIDNLLLERYSHSSGSGFDNFLKRIYYFLRPLTTRSVRRRVQKFYARNWRGLRFPHWPVDTSVENICEGTLLQALEDNNVERIPFVWFWPRGAHSCVMMTHDVETKVGRDFCEDLMDIDDSFGIKASFQVVPEGRYTVPKKFLESVRKRGFEVGIQDLNHDGRLFESRDRFRRRAVSINQYGKAYGARGFRAAVLYRNPEWYGDLEFSYDMSMPNVAHLDPQRGGCCTVMPYFIGNILELPVTTVQDYTLFHLLNDRSIALWKAQLQLILEKNGLASFIIHPDYVREGNALSVYKDLLSYLRDLRGRYPLWFALPRDVDTWWRARSQMSPVKVGGAWRIAGDRAEQAVLAYATRRDGKLVYELSRSGHECSEAGNRPRLN